MVEEKTNEVIKTDVLWNRTRPPPDVGKDVFVCLVGVTEAANNIGCVFTAYYMDEKLWDSATDDSFEVRLWADISLPLI